MEINDIDTFIHFFNRIHQRTSLVIEKIPSDKLDWKPNENSFSFADIIRHLSGIERFMFAENVQLKQSRYPGHNENLASGYEDVTSYYQKSHKETVNILQRLTSSDLKKKCQTPAGVEITIWKWLRSMIEHHVHHRGQLYTYLNILNIPTPPLYGLTSEEVREQSL